jgi:hypothetical protein
MIDKDSSGRIHPAIYALAALKLILHLSTNSRYGYFIDEFYYLACAEHLDFGYVDHPPMVAWLAWLSRHLLGDSLPALRLLPALAGTVLVLLAALIARELGGRAWAQALAALGVLFSPVLLFTSTVFSMNVFDVLFCSLALLLILRLSRTEGRALGLWTQLGAVFGIALLNKISPLFLGFGLLVGLLATPQRRKLLEPGPWLCGAIALVLFAPHLLWQVLHGWPTLEFMHNAATLKNRPLGFFEFLGSQAFEASPLGFLLLLAGLFHLLRQPALRLLGILYLTVFLVMVAGGGKPYYLAIFHPLMFAAGGVELELRLAARRRLLPVAAALLVLTGVLLLPLTLPILPVEAFIAYQQKLLGGPPASSERKSVGPLPQHFADMFGFRELVEQVAQVFHSLPAEEQQRTTIFAGSYGQAGAVSLFGPPLGLPKAISGHNSFYLWGPGPGDEKWGTVIVLGEEPEDLEPLFEEVVPAGRFSHPYAMPYRNDYPIVICRRAKQSAGDIWPLTKGYI